MLAGRGLDYRTIADAPLRAAEEQNVVGVMVRKLAILAVGRCVPASAAAVIFAYTVTVSRMCSSMTSSNSRSQRGTMTAVA
jgi:hypothetical protein